MSATPKRNQSCFCGSGRRFKSCCGGLEAGAAPENAPDGVLVVPNFVGQERCKSLIALADQLPNIDAGVKDYGPGGEKNLYSEQQRIAQIIDVSDEAGHFVPLVDYVFKARVNTFYGVETERFEFPQVLKYGPGGKHIKHNDAETPDIESGEWVRRIDRDYSILLYLNDDFTGGRLRFDLFDFELQPQAGMLVVFPSGHPYEHEAMPLESGLRYVIVSWGAVVGTPRVTAEAVGRVVYTEERFLPEGPIDPTE